MKTWVVILTFPKKTHIFPNLPSREFLFEEAHSILLMSDVACYVHCKCTIVSGHLVDLAKCPV